MPQAERAEVDLTLRLPNSPISEGEGALNFADTQINESTGTVALRAEFPNAQGRLVPGLFVTLMIETQKKTSLALVPQVAVQENQQGKFVLVVNEEKRSARKSCNLDAE